MSTTLPIRRITAVLIGTALVQVAVSAVATYARNELGITHIFGVTYLQVVRIDREVNNLPTWYSSSQLLLCALSVAAIGARTQRRRLAIRWWTLACLVLLMSIDESVRIHERLGALVRKLTGLDLPWVVPAGLAVLVALIATGQVWATVARGDRIRFAQGAIVFIAGAVGMEVVHKLVLPAADGFVHFALLHAEEGLEMCGIALLLRAAWLVIAPRGRLVLHVGPEEPAPVTQGAKVGTVRRSLVKP